MNNKRPIKTASDYQARNKIYSNFHKFMEKLWKVFKRIF